MISNDHPIALTIFRTEALERTPQAGTVLHETWSGLVRWASWPIVTAVKACGGFTLADLKDGIRRKSHVVSVSALGVDYDDEKIPLARGHELLASVAHVGYTTHSHTTGAPRWRAIVPYSRLVSVEEHRSIFDVVDGWFQAAGVAIDPATKDACRLWYVPAVKPGASFEFFAGDGPLMDVDATLAVAAELAAEREAARQRALAFRPPPSTTPDKAAYIRGAIRNAAGNIAMAAPGQRHAVLCAESYSLARLDLTESEIFSALEDPALRAMGIDRAAEIRRTIHDAVHARVA